MNSSSAGVSARQTHADRRALRRGRFHGHAPSLALDEYLGDRRAEADAANVALAGGMTAGEALEVPRQREVTLPRQAEENLGALQDNLDRVDRDHPGVPALDRSLTRQSNSTVGAPVSSSGMDSPPRRRWSTRSFTAWR